MSADRGLSHQEASLLLPWYLNGTLSGEERDAVQAHARDCISCRRDLEQQRALQRVLEAEAAAAMPTEPNVVALRARQLTRRHARSNVSAPAPASEPFSRLKWLLRPLEALRVQRPRFAAIALGFVAIGLAGVLTVALLPRQDPGFVTLTEPVQLPAGRYLRIVLHPDAGPDEAASFARRAGLSIAAGPTGRGVYTLASDRSDESFWNAARSTLEREADVLFVQGIVVGQGP
jgi:anti-sigma factor RsiW